MAFGAANGLIATMEKALASGADVNQLTDGFQKMTETDDEGSFDEYAAPLHPAAKNDEYAAAEWLLSHGADVRIRTRDGVGVCSTLRSMRTVLGQLVRARYPDPSKHECMQPQHIAVLFGIFSMLKLIIINQGGDPSGPLWYLSQRQGQAPPASPSPKQSRKPL